MAAGRGGPSPGYLVVALALVARRARLVVSSPAAVAEAPPRAPTAPVAASAARAPIAPVPRRRRRPTPRLARARGDAPPPRRRDAARSRACAIRDGDQTPDIADYINDGERPDDAPR